MTEQKQEDAGGASLSDAGLGMTDDQFNWLCDKMAEYQMHGFSVTKARELAMQDWYRVQHGT